MEKLELNDLLEIVHERLEEEFMSKYASWAKILIWLNARLDNEAATSSIKLVAEDYWKYDIMCKDSIEFSKSLYKHLYESNKHLDNAAFMEEMFNQMVTKRFAWLVKQKAKSGN